MRPTGLYHQYHLIIFFAQTHNMEDTLRFETGQVYMP